MQLRFFKSEQLLNNAFNIALIFLNSDLQLCPAAIPAHVMGERGAQESPRGLPVRAQPLHSQPSVGLGGRHPSQPRHGRATA